MSVIITCPDCKRRLKVSDTVAAKTIRCPACKSLIPPEVELRDADAESDEADTPPPRSVKTRPSPRLAATRARTQTPPVEESEDEDESVEEKPRRKKSAARGRGGRGKSSTGLILGLVAGGVGLLFVLGAVAGLLVYLARNKSSTPEGEWQAFSPPNGGCTVLLPGTPEPKPTANGTMYQVERKKDRRAFVVMVNDIPGATLRPDSLDILARSGRDGVLSQMSGSSVISETTISLGKLPGREFQIKLKGGGLIIGRIYLAKVGNTHRLFMVSVEGASIQANSGDAARFFDSFKIDASATPPAFADAAGAGGMLPPAAFNPPPNPLIPPPRIRLPRGPR